MSKPGKIVIRIIVALIFAAIITMAFAPDLAKPLLVDYYRSIYSADVVRTS